jgi:uncharacterized membrane protein
MHPPLFYILLHYLLKYFGNAACILRSISFFASLLSVIYLYHLGKTLFNPKTGLYAALFLSISGYGLWLGTYVRPYSLIMLLSLISTYQVCQLNSGNHLTIRNKHLYFYALTVILGLYTIYHFLFVFIFQITYLVLGNYKNRKALFAIFVIAALSFLCFLPWLPSLYTQMKVVSGGNFYFHQQVNLLRFIGDAASINCVRYFQIDNFTIKAIISMIFTCISTAVIMRGIYLSIKISKTRIFFFALIVYILAYLLLETILNLSSLHNIKMLFFIIPVMFIFLSAGVCSLTPRFRINHLVFTFFFFILMANSVAACCIKPKLGSPARYLEIFPPLISENTTPDKNTLVILNTNARRFLFPIAHATKTNFDIKILAPSSVLEQIPQMKYLEKYDSVYIVNIHKSRPEFTFSAEEIKILSGSLDNYHFTQQRYIETGKTPHLRSLHIFNKIQP